MSMKRFLITLAVFYTCQLCFAQTTYYDPTIYVTPNGLNTGNGMTINTAINADHFMENIYDSVYGGDITVKFAGGDYYTDFKFWGLPTVIQSIRLYGGFNFHSRNLSLPYRDLENYETIFHAVSQRTVWLEAVGYRNPNGRHTCIVDGITITSDGNVVNFEALALVGGNHVVSQCKIEHFSTNEELIWLETGGSNTVTFTNCLFDENKSKNLMVLASHVTLINVTIANNVLVDDMFIPYNSTVSGANYDYNMYNSIIYGNDNMDMSYSYIYQYGSFNVSHSILETQEGWVNDLGNNYFNTDPIFTSNTDVPYSCDYYNSPAIAAGDASWITLSSFYDSDIMDFDVANHDRYWDIPRYTVDIGAYQNGYDDGYYYYDVNPSNSRVPQKGEASISKNVSLRSCLQCIYINNVENAELNLFLYNCSGQIVYTTLVQSGYNCISPLLTHGVYIAKVASKEGEELTAKAVVL